MSIADRLTQASFNPQKAIYGDPIFFQDDEGEYSIEGRGIFRSQFALVDSVTQQEVVSDIPTIWISSPAPVTLTQGLKVRWKDEYFSIKEIHRDVDRNAYNILLHEIEGPADA